MDLKFLIILAVVVVHETNCVDFSQFYLPPCCYASSTAASNINARYEKPDVKNKSSGTIQLFVPQATDTEGRRASPGNSDEIKSSSQPSKKKSPTRTRLYRYIIPVGLEKREPRDSGSEETTEDSTELFRSAVSKNEFSSSMRAAPTLNIKSDLQKSIEKLLSSAQIETELVATTNKTLEQERDYLMKHPNETDVLMKHKRNIQQLHGMNASMVASHYDMPPNWVVNLKRALFQSMDSMLTATQKSGTSKDETIQAKSSNHNPFQGSSAEGQRGSKRLSYLWPRIREANFSYVEPLSKSASSALPQSLLMPMGQGPVASGVVVNTARGIELRMSSELHFQQDEPRASASDRNLNENNQLGCNCPLINNGETLLAYWSVSRILNEMGQNSLQYLIYPLPHNVPTPPRLMQFNNLQFNNPSQQYPSQPIQSINQAHAHLPTQFEHHNQRANYEELPPHLAEAPQEDPNYQQNFLQNSQPNYPAPYEQVFQNLQQFSQIPPPPRPVDDRTNFRGVVSQNHNGGYNPEFVNSYGQNQGQQQFQFQGPFGNPLQHPNFIPVGHPLGQTLATASPTPVLVSQTPNPGIYRKQNNRKNQHRTTPSHIQLFDGNNPDHPKSIQDLLTPYQHNGGLTTQTPIGAVPSGLVQDDLPNNFHQSPINNIIYNQNQQRYDGVVNFANKHHEHQHQGLVPQSPNKGFDINNYYSFAGGLHGEHYVNPAADLPHLPIDGNPNYHPVTNYHERPHQEENQYEYQNQPEDYRPQNNNRKEFPRRSQRPFYPTHQQGPVPLESFRASSADRVRDYYNQQNHRSQGIRQRSDRFVSSTRKPPVDNRGYIINF